MSTKKGGQMVYHRGSMYWLVNRGALTAKSHMVLGLCFDDKSYAVRVINDMEKWSKANPGKNPISAWGYTAIPITPNPGYIYSLIHAADGLRFFGLEENEFGVVSP